MRRTMMVLASLLLLVQVAFGGNFLDTARTADQTGQSGTLRLQGQTQRTVVILFGHVSVKQLSRKPFEPRQHPAAGDSVLCSFENVFRTEVTPGGKKTVTKLTDGKITWACSGGEIQTSRTLEDSLRKFETVWKLPASKTDATCKVSCLFESLTGDLATFSSKEILIRGVIKPPTDGIASETIAARPAPEILGLSPVCGQASQSFVVFSQALVLDKIPFSNYCLAWRSSVGSMATLTGAPAGFVTNDNTANWSLDVPNDGAAPTKVTITCSGTRLDGKSFRVSRDFVLRAPDAFCAVGSATATVDPKSTTTINKQIRDGSQFWVPDRIKNLSSTLLKNLVKGFFGVTLSDISGVDRWTQTQLVSLYTTLYSLPKTFSKYLTQLVREKLGFNSTNILGYMYWSQPFKAIICDSAFNYKAFAETLVHEMGHIYSAKTPGLESKWQAAFYTKNSAGRYTPIAAPPTSYGATSIKEDMAESVKYYWLNGAGMKTKCPDRYEFVRQYIMDSYEYRSAK